MVTVDPNTGLYHKSMHLDEGVITLFTPSDNGARSKERLYIRTWGNTTLGDGSPNNTPGLTKREVEALIENLQQVLDMGALDE